MEFRSENTWLQDLRPLALGLGVLALCGFSTVMALAKPHCEDSAIKLAILVTGFFCQWIAMGAVGGLIAKRRSWLHGLLIGAASAPLVAALWMGLLWIPRQWSLSLYLLILFPFAAMALTLTTLGGFIVDAGRSWSRRRIPRPPPAV